MNVRDALAERAMANGPGHWRGVAIGLAAAGVIAGGAMRAEGQCQPQWRTGSQQNLTGANSAVQALLQADPDGSGPAPTSVIASGTFTFIGGTRTGGVAYWNESSGWVPMGRTTGSTSGENLYTLAFWNGQVVVGGGFAGINEGPAGGAQPRNVAAWNGTEWVAMSAANDASVVQSLAVLNGELWALGRDVNPVSAPVLRKYIPGPTTQTGTWQVLGATISGQGTRLVVFNNELYIIGSFSRAATPSARFQVAKLNAAGTDVVELPALISSSTALSGGVVYLGELYVYGSGLLGGTTSVAKLNGAGTAWVASTAHASASAVQNISPTAAEVLYGTLHVGTSFGSSSVPVLYSLNGATGVWTAQPVVSTGVTSGPSIGAMCVAPDGVRLAVGGSGTFSGIAQTSATRFALWNPSSNVFSTPTPGLGDHGFGYPFVNAVAEFAGDLYLGGSYFGIGTQVGRSLGKFNGTTLTPVDGAPNVDITYMWGDSSAGRLYLGGSFAAIEYNGATFTALPSTPGVFPSGAFSMNAATRYAGNLVAGTGSGSYLATLSGGTWQTLGGVAPNGSVTALTTWSSPLIAGGSPLLVATGQFTQVGTLATRVAAWDGLSWRALGQPSFAGYSANPAVSLLVHGGDLYLSAYITSINGVSTYPYLIRYNAATDRWDEVVRPPTSVSTGFGTPVRAVSAGGSIWVALRGANLPQTSDNVALLRWDGNAWSNMGGIAGLFPQINDATNYNGDVVIGGLFGVVGTRLPSNAVPNQTYNGVGGVGSVGWARLQTANQAGPLVTTQPQPRQVSRGCGTTFGVQGTTNSPPLSYLWQYRESGVGSFVDVLAGANAGGRFTASGQTLTTLTLSSVNIGPALEFRAMVSDACGSTPSAAAQMQSCIADANCSGAVTVQDVFDLLTLWFAGDARADVNNSGQVTVQDVFDYLNAWFAGC